MRGGGEAQGRATNKLPLHTHPPTLTHTHTCATVCWKRRLLAPPPTPNHLSLTPSHPHPHLRDGVLEGQALPLPPRSRGRILC